MGVAPTKIMFEVIFSLKRELIVAKKLTNKYKEKFVILQSIGIIVIKSRETRQSSTPAHVLADDFNSDNITRID